MGGRSFIDISEEPLSCEAALAFAADPTHGAVATFVGQIRNHNLGKTVSGVSYDVFVPLAKNIFEAICGRARRQWGDDLNIWLVHHKGHLAVGGLSIVIAVSSPHRDEAFQACRFIIEEVKHRAPIWKQEHYPDGDSEWVKGHALCSHGSHSSAGNASETERDTNGQRRAV